MNKKKGFNRFALFMFIVVAYFGTVLISQQVHLSHVSESQHLADKRLNAAQTVNDKLRKERDELNNLENIEKIAREDLGLAKKDELPYRASK